MAGEPLGKTMFRSETYKVRQYSSSAARDKGWTKTCEKWRPPVLWKQISFKRHCFSVHQNFESMKTQSFWPGKKGQLSK